MSKISPVSKLPQLYTLMFISLSMFLAESASEGATLSRLRVGYPSPSASFFPLFATKEAGLLEKYGFETEMVYVQGVQLVQVHVAGQLDFSTISSVVYLQASVEGADLIQVASSIDNQLMKLMVHPSIAKPEDLRGKTLAVTRFGSLTDLLIRPVLKNWGLEPQKDVKLIQIGRMPDSDGDRSEIRRWRCYLFSDIRPSGKNEYQNDAGFCGIRFRFAGNHGGREPALQQKQPHIVLRFLKAYIEGTRRLFADRELGIRALRQITAALTIATCWLRLTIFLRPDTSRKFPTSTQRELKTR